MTAKTFVGIDLHKTTLTIGVRDSSGELTNTTTIPTKCVNRVIHFFSHLPSPVHCAIESVGMYEWLWELLEPRVDKLMLADAVELRYRAGKRHAKTDKIDAKFISLLVSRNEVPESFVPDKATREFRRLGRHWHSTTETMTDIKIRMRWILLQHNLPGPGSITGESGQKWFLSWGEHLSPMAQLSFSQMLESIEHLERQRVVTKRHILDFCQRDQFKEDIALLKTVPGIADVLASIILAEVAGFHRFYSTDAIACYSGLTERTEQSGGRVSFGNNISRAGSPALRWALCEAVNTLIRSDPSYKAMYLRIFKSTKLTGKAKVAMAQKLIRWLWKMHQTREPFRRGGSTNHNRKANKARLQLRMTRLQAEMDRLQSQAAICHIKPLAPC